jgi:hypothetical protein
MGLPRRPAKPTQGRDNPQSNGAELSIRGIVGKVSAVRGDPLSMHMTAIDYNFNAGHRDHFHCDTNRGDRDRRPRGVTTTFFTQEALSHVLGKPITLTGRFDAATERGLSEFSGRAAGEFRDDRVLNQVLTDLYTRIATGR